MFLETIPHITVEWRGKAHHASVTFMKSEIKNRTEAKLKVPRYLFSFSNLRQEGLSPFLIISPEVDVDGSRWIAHENSGIKDRELTKAAGLALEIYLSNS
jgi:hypothetical protein